ncbi:hypothetical protein AMECASPLE_024077 [Ameca splendens]|uniref:Uncharacterized protein n=1 Tax=Ameca splendens TaxID=208324 RepID=A0ABV0ZE44_9TELE
MSRKTVSSFGGEAGEGGSRRSPRLLVARPQWRGESKDQGKNPCSTRASLGGCQLFPGFSIVSWERSPGEKIYLARISPLLNSFTIPPAWSRWLVPSVLKWVLLKLEVFRKPVSSSYSFPGFQPPCSLSSLINSPQDLLRKPPHSSPGCSPTSNYRIHLPIYPPTLHCLLLKGRTNTTTTCQSQSL